MAWRLLLTQPRHVCGLSPVLPLSGGWAVYVAPQTSQQHELPSIHGPVGLHPGPHTPGPEHPEPAQITCSLLLQDAESCLQGRHQS